MALNYLLNSFQTMNDFHFVQYLSPFLQYQGGMADYFPCVSLLGTDQLRSVFNLAGSQKLSIIIYGPLVLLVSIFNMGVLIGVKAYRQPPSDILLFSNIFSILKIFVIYLTMIYDNVYPVDSVPSNYNSFCVGTGFINILAENAKGLYTIVFCFYYVKKVKNPLKAWNTKNKEVHFVCILVVLIITFGIYLGGAIGVTPYGYCGFFFNAQSGYINAGLTMGYVLILIIASGLFLRYITKIENKNFMTASYIRYYFCFLFFFCANQALLTIAHFMAVYTCINEVNQHIFNIAKATANCCASISPFFVFVIILSNGKNGKIAFFKAIKCIRTTFEKLKLGKKNKNQMLGNQRFSFYQDLMTSQRNPIIIQLSQLQSNEGYLGQLKDKNRAFLLSSLLGCLSIHHFQLKNNIQSQSQLRTSMVQQDEETIFLWNYFQKSSFIFNQTLYMHYKHLFIENLQIINLKFTAYSPNILTQFMEMDKIKGVSEAISPIYNSQDIINDSKNSSDGGRSGQFFFFNHDRTFILKTISLKEKTVFVSRIQAFHKHYREHPFSLIVKLYSVFTLELTQMDQVINCTLMINLLRKIDRKYVARVYDLKGSSHQRAVLNSQQLKSSGRIIDKTLKDEDFKVLQQKIWVSKEDAQKLKKLIQKDSEFFLQQGLIDYSLIVIKIDLGKIVEEKGQNFNEIIQNVVLYKDIRQKGMAYALGIIDYLQTWNIRKKGQKWYKSIFAKTQGISSQDPAFYSKRFIDFASKILQV